ncbi:hypothetical protein WJX72_003009 [[Myrmecia] bisecta]|uniref:Small ubiquitin-related modifier n=1 Tax=[Myrmecia] bisecta TaxID=41462 RepID=A0AAW1PWT7_9CHLO
MPEESGETKPKVEGGSETIQLKVKDQTGGEVHFKVKTTTKFEKIMQAYCQKKSIDMAGMRFLFEGTRINNTSTPADLGMEDDDIIDAVMEQVGGRC